MTRKVKAAAVLDLGLWPGGSLDRAGVGLSGRARRHGLGRLVVVLDGGGGDRMMGLGGEGRASGHRALLLEAALAEHVVLLLGHGRQAAPLGSGLLVAATLAATDCTGWQRVAAVVGHAVLAVEKDSRLAMWCLVGFYTEKFVEIFHSEFDMNQTELMGSKIPV